jgi:hypothetical protein
MPRHAAYCGLYCGACCSMIAHEKQQGDPSAREVITDENEQPCTGCDAENQQNCEFVVCNKTHGTDSCAFCPDFPCTLITRFSHEEWEHHQVVLDNLNRIKETGTAQWLKEMQERFQCPACHSRTIWYQKKCTNCGADILINM